MKYCLPLHLAAVLCCSLLASSCQKESDSIQPAMSAVVPTNRMPVNHPIYADLGGSYDHYPVLTGASNYYIPMTMTDLHITPVSTIENWQSKGVVPEQYRPLDADGNSVPLPYVFKGGTQVGDILIASTTFWKADGTVEMNIKSVYNYTK